MNTESRVNKANDIETGESGRCFEHPQEIC